MPAKPTTPESAARRALHAVAELVLAGPQFRHSGTIRLRVAPGGFATTAEPRLAIDRGELVHPGGRVPITGRSCAELADVAGLTAGAPEGVYADGTGVSADEILDLDAPASAALAGAFGRGEAALRRFAPDQTPVLWPEHFDVAISIGEVNYGVSPGDEFLDEPYAYVGPWQPRAGEFWNAPFGAARPLREMPDVGDIVAFLAEGRDHAAP